MIDYSTIPNTSGAYPVVVGLNSTGPGLNDGTPYLKNIIDDLWGFNQALLNAVGGIPSGSAEADGASQRLDAIKKIAGHPGEVVAWMGAAADPSVNDIRLLPLNGQGVLRATYDELDAACYVGDSNNPTASAFYRADDAGGVTRNIVGIYLILPDLRGFFIRGLDLSGGWDPDGASRDIGDVQDIAVPYHTHNDIEELSTGDKYYGEDLYVYTSSQPSTSARRIAQSNQSTAFKLYADFFDITPQQGVARSETRPVNSAARWCIRF
jgi:hypothetical protein